MNSKIQFDGVNEFSPLSRKRRKKKLSVLSDRFSKPLKADICHSQANALIFARKASEFQWMNEREFIFVGVPMCYFGGDQRLSIIFAALVKNVDTVFHFIFLPFTSLTINGHVFSLLLLSYIVFVSYCFVYLLHCVQFCIFVNEKISWRSGNLCKRF